MASLSTVTCRNPVFGMGTPDECPTGAVEWFAPQDLLRFASDLRTIGCRPTPFPWPAKFSPITYVRPGASFAPVRVEHGTADCTVSMLQSQRMDSALVADGQYSMLVMQPGLSHGAHNPAWNQPGVYEPTLAWIGQVMRGVIP
jgi:hypothetical protein